MVCLLTVILLEKSTCVLKQFHLLLTSNLDVIHCFFFSLINAVDVCTLTGVLPREQAVYPLLPNQCTGFSDLLPPPSITPLQHTVVLLPRASSGTSIFLLITSPQPCPPVCQLVTAKAHESYLVFYCRNIPVYMVLQSYFITSNFFL
jgi:hypothetical protein